MTRQDINQNFLRTAFLDGANATYVEALQARFEKDPNSVEPGWREFFESLGDDADNISKAAAGPSWERPHWPLTPSDELTHALDGDWPPSEKAISSKLKARAAEHAVEAPSEDSVMRATRDSVRALMM